MTQNFHASGVSGACPHIDMLSDLHAGVLDDIAARGVRQHVATCSDCTELMAALDETVASLHAMPEVQIPADVAGRIDRAIASEAARTGLGDDLTRSLAPTAQRPTPARSAYTVAPAAPAGPTAPPTTSRVTNLDQHRQRRAGRGKLLLAAAAAAAVLGLGSIILTQHNSGRDAANQAGGQQSVSSAPTKKAPGEVQAFRSPKDVLDEGAIEDDKVSADVAGKMAELAERNKCLNAIIPRPTDAPLAVQAGTYGGKDAFAFIFPTTDAATIEMIVVNAADCSEILHTQKGPRT